MDARTLNNYKFEYIFNMRAPILLLFL